MKVVVTSQGAELDSPVDPRFGRAPYFMLVDTDTGQYVLHDNVQNLSAPHGAGIQAAEAVVRLGARAVLTGHVGPKALATLQAGQVTVYPGATGTVRQVLDQFRAGRMQPAGQPTVEGHGG